MNATISNRLIAHTADLHLHSALSPCAEDRMNPDEVLNKIMRLGIDVFSITDHNSGSNCAAFEAAARRNGITFIPGIEVQSSEEIHLLGYFPDMSSLDTFCTTVVNSGMIRGMKNDPKQFGNQITFDVSGDVSGEEEGLLSMPLTLSIDELVDQIHTLQGVAVAAHVDRGFSIISQLGYIPSELRLDAIEIWDVSKIEDFRSKYLTGTALNIISSTDSHHIHMMKRPNMKLWLQRTDVPSCLDCIMGIGTGRITITEKGKRDHRKREEHLAQGGEKSSKKNWQSLYKK